MARTASGFILLSICCCGLARAAAVLGAPGQQDGQTQAQQGSHQAAASTVQEQPLAAESSYGGYGQSYVKQPKYSGAQYQAPAYDSYASPDSYGTPYITGSCYGQYPGMTGNVDYDCKTYSVCQADGRLDVLYCPPYTRFNNYLGVCDWHFKVDSYCQPLYKEEPYQANYKSSYGGASYEKSAYGYEKSHSNYEQAAPVESYYGPVKSSYTGYAGASYEAPPSYGHRSVYPSAKKY